MEWQAESAQTDPDAEEDASRMSCRESAMKRDLYELRTGKLRPTLRRFIFLEPGGLMQ